MSTVHASLTDLDEMTQKAQDNPELRKEIQDFRTNVLEQYLVQRIVFRSVRLIY